MNCVKAMQVVQNWVDRLRTFQAPCPWILFLPWISFGIFALVIVVFSAIGSIDCLSMNRLFPIGLQVGCGSSIGLTFDHASVAQKQGLHKAPMIVRTCHKIDDTLNRLFCTDNTSTALPCPDPLLKQYGEEKVYPLNDGIAVWF